MLKLEILKLLQQTDGFVSGQKICEELGVSRTAVWKGIQQLTQDGCQIEAVRNKGYCLIQEPDLLIEEVLSQYLGTAWAGRQVRILDEVDSTNDEAKRLAEAGAVHGTLILAKKQTAGKGRRGRSFESREGDGLFMSLLIRADLAPERASMLTLVMGMAVTKALEELTGLHPQIKWPNDVVISGKKICGILTEMSMQMDCINYLVLGVGVNIHNRDFSDELSDRATSVHIEQGKEISRGHLAAEILKWFEYYYDKYLPTQDLALLVDTYNTWLINRNHQVTVMAAKGAYEGLALGINTQGELMVQTREEVKYVMSGEVSLRGVCGYV